MKKCLETNENQNATHQKEPKSKVEVFAQQNNVLDCNPKIQHT